MRYILIITYGRSGSTLLQGILNTHKQVLIRGENANILYHSFKMYESIITSRKTGSSIPKPDIPQNPWYGYSLLKEESFINSLRELFIKEIIQADHIENLKFIGFKEIRYYNLPDLRDYLRFIIRLFDNPFIIFHTRKLDDVIKSGWWKTHPNQSKLVDNLKLFEECIHNFDYSRIYNSQYEKLQNPNELESLFTFLNLNMPDKEELILTLNSKHSS